MSLIWRCCARAAKESFQTRTPIHEVLKKIGWEIHPRAEPLDEDMTCRELTMWVHRNALETKQGEKE
jgi:hypothetical protein